LINFIKLYDDFITILNFFIKKKNTFLERFPKSGNRFSDKKRGLKTKTETRFLTRAAAAVNRFKIFIMVRL